MLLQVPIDHRSSQHSQDHGPPVYQDIKNGPSSLYEVQQQHQRGHSVTMATGCTRKDQNVPTFGVSNEMGGVSSVKFGSMSYATALKYRNESAEGDEEQSISDESRSGLPSQTSSRVSTPEIGIEKESDICRTTPLPSVVVATSNEDKRDEMFSGSDNVLTLISTADTCLSPRSPVGVASNRNSPVSHAHQSEVVGVSSKLSELVSITKSPLAHPREEVTISSSTFPLFNDIEGEKEEVLISSDTKSHLNITAHEFVPCGIPHTDHSNLLTCSPSVAMETSIVTKPKLVKPVLSSKVPPPQQQSILNTPPPQLIHMMQHIQLAMLNAAHQTNNNKRFKSIPRMRPNLQPVPLPSMSFPPHGQVGSSLPIMMSYAPPPSHPILNYPVKHSDGMTTQMRLPYIDRCDGIHSNLAMPIHPIQATPTMHQGMTTIVPTTLQASVYPPPHIATPSNIQPNLSMPMAFQQIGSSLSSRAMPPTQLHSIDQKAQPSMRPPLLPTPPNFNLLVGATPVRPVITPTSMFSPVWSGGRMPSPVGLSGSDPHMMSPDNSLTVAMQHQVV